MRPECAAEINNALGRMLDKEELDGIENRLKDNMRRLASRMGHDWLKLSQADQLQMAARAAKQEMIDDANLKRLRTMQNIVARGTIYRRLQDKRFKSALEALDRTLAFDAGDRNFGTSVHSEAMAIGDLALGQILEGMPKGLTGKWMGLVQDKKGQLEIYRALKGEKVDDPELVKWADAFHETMEGLRQRNNRAGGNIKYLKGYDMPHSWSRVKIADDKKNWLVFHQNYLDWGKYRKADGSLLNAREQAEFLEGAWSDLATGGASERINGQPTFRAKKMTANELTEHRTLFYKNAEVELEAQTRYGDRPFFDVVSNYVRHISRNIALMEHYGPNPDVMFEWALNTAETMDAERAKKTAHVSRNTKKVERQKRQVKRLFEEVAGVNDEPVSETLSNVTGGIRSINVASKLGFAAITSLADQSTYLTTLQYNGMSVLRGFMNEFRMMVPKGEAFRYARRAGLGIEAITATLNRWGVEEWGSADTWSGKFAEVSRKLASISMSLSLLNGLTRAGRQGFGLQMFDTIGDMTRRFASMKDVDTQSRGILSRFGVEDLHWEIWKKAKTSDLRGVGDTVLSPSEIYEIPDAALSGLSGQYGMSARELKDRAATKLLALTKDESLMAVVDPGPRSRKTMYAGTAKGTFAGEFIRSFWQFKGTTFQIFAGHMKRGFTMPGVSGKARYLATWIGMSTILGAVALQFTDIAKGRDPRDMTDKQFWLAALLKGGALGIYADFLLNNETSFGSGLISTASGPVIGDVEELAKIFWFDWQQMAKGKDTHPGARAVRFTVNHIPFANTWYLKAGLDHFIFQQMQEAASPGFLSRMESRAMRDFNQEFWWRPGEFTPERAPDMGRMAGRD